MSFSYPQQPIPPFGGLGAPGVSPQGWQPAPMPMQPMMPPPQPMPAVPQDKGDTEGLALLTVAIIFHILLNVYWLYADNHLIHLDEAHHINCAVAYYEALFPADETGLFERCVAALKVESPYPPLTHLVGAVFIRVLGYSPDIIAASGCLFLTLFLLGVYLFARQGMTARNAFLAALVAGFMPMAFAGSRYFMPDLLLAALVTWALFALLKSERFRKTGWVAFFALFTGLAFLTKQTAVIYLLLPSLWIFGWGAFSTIYPSKGPGLPLRRHRAAQLLFNTLLCLFIVLGVCSWWYTRHVEYMYTWWNTQRGGETGILQPAIASHIEFAMPHSMEGAESRIYLDPAISRLTIPAQTIETPPPAAVPEQPVESPASPPQEGEVSEVTEGEADLLEGKELAAIAIDSVAAASEGEASSMPFAGARERQPEGEIEELGAAGTDMPKQPPEDIYAALAEPFQLYGDVYPLYFVNEIAFLPITLLALFGLPALLRKRNRSAMSMLMLVWLGGAYVLLTGVFSLRGPILLYACAPPAGVLCAMALDSVPRYRLRRALWCVLFVFLGLQYINLTLFSYGPIGRADIPVLAENKTVTEQQNKGLTVYKDKVYMGHYLLHPPERGQAITEVLLDAMVNYEKNRSNPSGPVAWYQVVSDAPSYLSLDFYARHYQQVSGSVVTEKDEEGKEKKMARPFAAAKWECYSPEDTLPELAETEYLVLKQGLDSAGVGQLEAWAAHFSSQGFESIYNKTFAGYGLSSPGYVHLMTRQEIPSLASNPDLFQIYELLRQDGTLWLLSEEERKAAEQRYTLLVQEYSHVQPLSTKVNLLGFHVKSVPDNWHVLRLIVQATDAIPGGTRLWLRATVHPEDRGRMIAHHSGQDTLIWDFAPQPEPTAWKPNQALVLCRPVLAAPLRYKLQIGICEGGQPEPAAAAVETDWVDFGAEH